MSATTEITHEFPLNNVSTNIIIDSDSTVVNGLDEVDRSNTSGQSSHKEQTLQSTIKIFRKSNASFGVLPKIVFAKKQSKSGKHNGGDSKFFSWCTLKTKKGVIRNLFCNEFETLSINLFGLKTLRKTSLENEGRITNVSYEPMHNFKRLRTCLRNALSTLKILLQNLRKG